MDIHDLVSALLSHDALAAREWVAEAQRVQLRWSELPKPSDMTGDPLAVAAGVVELLASRAGEQPPSWTASVPAASQRIFLVRAASSMPRLRRLCEEESPEPLRRRRVLAPPEFLTVA